MLKYNNQTKEQINGDEFYGSISDIEFGVMKIIFLPRFIIMELKVFSIQAMEAKRGIRKKVIYPTYLFIIFYRVHLIVMK